MPKLTATDLTSLTNESTAISQINANFAAVEVAMEKTLSRDGSSPNTMSASLDVNSQKIINVASGTASTDGVNLAQLTSATGQVPGLSMLMETTTTDSDQGAGKVWFNAAVASATIIYVDDADTNSANISTFAQTWDDSTTTASRGYIYVIQKASAVNYALFEIDGAVTDATGYNKIPVNYVIGAGTLADGDPVTVNFIKTGDKGATGSTGSTGPTGAQGSGEGLAFAFESTTTDADQGVGKVFYNHGTVASASIVYIDDVDADGANVNTFVDTFDDSGSTIKGRITVKKKVAPENYHMFNVNGSVTSASTYSKIPVAHVASVGTISDGDLVHLSFSRAGDKGNTGSGTGDLLASNNLSDVGSASTSLTNLGGVGLGMVLALG